MANTVVGVFENVGRAEEAVQELLNNGFYASSIDISNRKRDTGTGYQDPDNRDGLTKFFSNLFGDNDEAKNYSSVAGRGAVVTVHSQSRQEAEKAAYILDMFDAVDPNERAEYFRKSGDSYYNQSAGDVNNPNYNESGRTYTGGTGVKDDFTADSGTTGEYNTGDVYSDEDKINAGASIPVIEEDMQVGKRNVEKDTVRVRSRIFEKPVEEHLRLRTELISVERTPINRPVKDKDDPNFKEITIEATEHEEVPIVKKEARVVEEVKIKKEVEERDKAIRGSVRKQDVDIERKSRDREFTSGEEDEDLL